MRDVFRSRPWLGRATILASVTVLLAAGGGAYAASTGNTSRNGTASRQLHGPFASARSAPFIAGAAVVNPSGTVARSIGVTSASQLGTGEYQVLFTHKVNHCGYTATLGNTGAGFPPVGQISVAARSGHKNGVYVATFNSSGVLTNFGFHLAVIC